MLRDPQKILNLMTFLRIVQTGLEAEGQKFLFSVSQKCSKENAVSFNDLLDFIPTLTSLQSQNYFIFFCYVNKSISCIDSLKCCNIFI